MSFWYAATPSCDGRFSPLIGRADAALYEAKRGGRNRAAIAPDFPLEAAERRVVFEAAAAVSSRDPRSIIETEGRGPYRAKIVTRNLLCVCFTHIRTELAARQLHIKGRCSPTLAQTSREYHLRNVMIDALEKRLIEALKSVDAQGDVAPAHVHDPMTMVLRENAIQANLMRWDDAGGRYVLTGTGRGRIRARARAPGTVVPFRKREARG